MTTAQDEHRLDLGTWRRANPRTIGDAVREVALALPLPLLPHVDVAVAHLEASAQGRTGSFATAVGLPGGRVALVAGEVAAPEATAALAILRITAVIEERLTAGATLEQTVAALDHFVQGTPVEGSVLCLAVVDPRARTLTHVSAGDRTPIRVRADSTRPLGRGTEAPLGTGGPRRSSVTVLADDEVVLLCGGGCVDAAVPVLAALAVPDHEGSQPDAAGAVCAGLLEHLAEAPDAGDTSVLAVHLRSTPPPLEVVLPAAPRTPWAGQELVDGWLATVRAEPADREALDEVVTELLANAVEHGSDGGPDGTVRLEARLQEDGVVVLEVHDAGVWDGRDPRRGPRPDPGRGGLGLAVVRQLVDDLRVMTTGTGTTVRVRRRLRRTPSVLTLPCAAEGAPREDRLTVRTIEGAVATVAATGELTASTAPTLRSSLDIASNGGTVSVVLDGEGLTRVSASGIRLLRQLERSLTAHGARLVVVADPSGPAGRAVPDATVAPGTAIMWTA